MSPLDSEIPTQKFLKSKHCKSKMSGNPNKFLRKQEAKKYKIPLNEKTAYLTMRTTKNNCEQKQKAYN